MKKILIAVAFTLALTFGAGMFESFTGIEMSQDAQAGKLWGG